MKPILSVSNAVKQSDADLIDQFRQHLRFDPETGKLRRHKPIGHRRIERPVGTPATQSGRYPVVRFGNQLLYVHRVVWALHHGEFPGVGRIIDDRWMATIMANRVSYWLGMSSTEFEAARSDNVAAVRRFGEYARPNLPRKLTCGDSRNVISLKINPFMAKQAPCNGMTRTPITFTKIRGGT